LFAPAPALLTLIHSVTPGGWASAEVGTSSPSISSKIRIPALVQNRFGTISLLLSEMENKFA
jgi:hypothetical protein